MISVLKHLADELENYLCTFLMSCMVLLLFIQVVARYFFGTGVDWSEELSRFFFVWIVVWSVAYTSKVGGQIRVTLFLKLLPMKGRLLLFWLGELIWIIFNVVVIYEGTRLVMRMFDFPMISPTVRINTAWVFTAVPLGFLFCTVRIIQWHWQHWGEETRKFLEEE